MGEHGPLYKITRYFYMILSSTFYPTQEAVAVLPPSLEKNRTALPCASAGIAPTTDKQTKHANRTVSGQRKKVYLPPPHLQALSTLLLCAWLDL